MGRCAACKYLRRRCPSDCIFSPYFPSNDPQRFAILHKIYGASNVGKILLQLPSHDLRAEAVDSMYFEARCRVQDPVYGCVGMISALHQQLHKAESELAKTRAEISVFGNNNNAQEPLLQHIDQPQFNRNLLLQEQSNVAQFDVSAQSFPMFM